MPNPVTRWKEGEPMADKKNKSVPPAASGPFAVIDASEPGVFRCEACGAKANKVQAQPDGRFRVEGCTCDEDDA
jgi:hypothetical protein